MPTKAVASPFSRPRWTEQDARGARAALQRSGKSVRAFSTEHGLDPQRLYSWKRRLGGAEPSTFQEVIVRPAPRPAPVVPSPVASAPAGESAGTAPRAA